MDILHLVDRLEELFNRSRPIPFTRSVIVDEDRFLEIIDQMRVSIPAEVKRAQQLEAQRDRILAQAQEEGNRTITLAKQKSEDYISRDAIVKAGQARAEQIIQQAKIEADAVRRDADDYALEALGNVETELIRLINQARNGIAKLTAERHASLNREGSTDLMEEEVDPMASPPSI
jgi:cell division septum initiation protein DivIVA